MTDPMTLTTFSPARALWNQRAAVREAAPRLRQLIEAVDFTNDLAPMAWAHWFSAALEFRPDLIIELGRGRGNSTALFTDAANRLGDCRVLSLCMSEDWQGVSAPRIAPQVPADWSAPLEARIVNFLSVDLTEDIMARKRVLLLWDAHGYAVASYVLGHILPLLQDRAHLVLMHDITDTRYNDSPRAYHPGGIWTGANQGDVRLHLGHLDSAVEQVVAISDFCARNGLELHSADHAFHTELTRDEQETLSQELGEFYGRNGHWFWFTLNDLSPSRSVVFPPYTLDAHLMHETIEQLQHRVQVMEASPFWKLRNLVMRLMGRG